MSSDTLYTFEEAMSLVKYGQRVKHKRATKNEYCVQYGRDLNGEPFWTAGGTVGGPLTPNRYPRNPDEKEFEIYGNPIYEQ
ncbi:hypothetical protein vBAfQDWS535_33 [Alcaligenes phage vB_Af_QDWS535]|nr:hypothetical protein vBAfQDWS535_33 [Alcaligenes phage vB_Af_QDWS535]